jgi:glycine/D-amino acid oxidase-like deaminating enzyme
VRDTFTTLTAVGLAATCLEPHEVARRFPQISVDGLGPAVWEPQAGVIRARAAVQALVGYLVAQRSVTFRVAHVLAMDEQSSTVAVRTSDGEELAADGYVFACGPWLPRMFPESIGDRIRPTRQEVLYFGVPPGDNRFAISQLPVWIDFAAGVYGIPDLDALGFKVGIDRHGPVIDPDSLDRYVDAELVHQTRRWMAHRFPGLHAAPLIDARVCQYENTATGDFIIDRHSRWDNVWIAGGGSGHGFKHGPAVGRAVTALVGGGHLDSRFSLTTKSAAAARSVY